MAKKPPKVKKPRSNKYEEKLKVNASLENLIKIAVSKPNKGK